MKKIQNFVFFDLETTGLPHQEKNRTKITELCFVVVSRKDIEITSYGKTPPVQKLSLLFNPERNVQPDARRLTGLSQKFLKNCSRFSEKVDTIVSFLEGFEKPVCLIAHNGNRFDYKILMAEFVNCGKKIPNDLLCVDSLTGFRKFLKESDINYVSLSSDSDILTDDEDDWPKLNVSDNDWIEIDKLSSSLSDVSFEDKVDGIGISRKAEPEKEDFKLTTIYKRLLNKESNAHRAEADCMMLMQCVVAIKHLFLPWADEASSNVNLIAPFVPL